MRTGHNDLWGTENVKLPLTIYQFLCKLVQASSYVLVASAVSRRSRTTTLFPHPHPSGNLFSLLQVSFACSSLDTSMRPQPGLGAVFGDLAAAEVNYSKGLVPLQVCDKGLAGKGSLYLPISKF